MQCDDTIISGCKHSKRHTINQMYPQSGKGYCFYLTQRNVLCRLNGTYFRKGCSKLGRLKLRRSCPYKWSNLLKGMHIRPKTNLYNVYKGTYFGQK